MEKQIINIIKKRTFGNQNVSFEERTKKWVLMQKLYDEYKETNVKLNHLLNIEWEEKQIEEHYCDKIFVNAHRKLRTYENKIKIIHKSMFHILTTTDRFDIKFNSNCLEAEEIYYDFKRKYIDTINIDVITETEFLQFNKL